MPNSLPGGLDCLSTYLDSFFGGFDRDAYARVPVFRYFAELCILFGRLSVCLHYLFLVSRKFIWLSTMTLAALTDCLYCLCLS